MGLSGIAPWVQNKQTASSGSESKGQTRRSGPNDFLARPLENLMYMEVDPNWLDQHPNIADDYRARLTFTFFDVEAGITELANASYGSIDVTGRPEAYKTYANTSNKEIQLTFNFHAQGLEAADSTVFDPTTGTTSQNSPKSVESVLMSEVVKPARFIDSLKYPIEDPNNGLSFAPPPVLVKMGSLFVGRCLIQDASIIWHEPFDPNTLLPEAADVQCTLMVVRTVPRNYLVAAGPIEGQWR